jgi:hypothetical protein
VGVFDAGVALITWKARLVWIETLYHFQYVINGVVDLDSFEVDRAVAVSNPMTAIPDMKKKRILKFDIGSMR